jgi:hypothetical protein
MRGIILGDAAVLLAIASLAPTFAAAGLSLEEARTMPADEVAVLETTWAKRLSHRQPPPSVYVRLRRGADV